MRPDPDDESQDSDNSNSVTAPSKSKPSTSPRHRPSPRGFCVLLEASFSPEDDLLVALIYGYTKLLSPDSTICASVASRYATLPALPWTLRGSSWTAPGSCHMRTFAASNMCKRLQFRGCDNSRFSQAEVVPRSIYNRHLSHTAFSKRAP